MQLAKLSYNQDKGVKRIISCSRDGIHTRCAPERLQQVRAEPARCSRCRCVWKVQSYRSYDPERIIRWWATEREVWAAWPPSRAQTTQQPNNRYTHQSDQPTNHPTIDTTDSTYVPLWSGGNTMTAYSSTSQRVPSASLHVRRDFAGLHVFHQHDWMTLLYIYMYRYRL